MRRAQFSVSARFMLVLIIGITIPMCIAAVSLYGLKQALLQARTNEVKHLLETAYSTVVYYHDQAVKRRMTDAAAREAARNAVRAMRYDGNNYFFIWATNGTAFPLESDPEWEGKNLLVPLHSTKLPVVSHMVDSLIAGFSSDGMDGVVTYRIPKPGQTTPLRKIAYSRLFEPWGWSIGTGAYVNDIDAQFSAHAIWLASVFSGLIALASLLTFLLGRNLSGAMKRLSVRVASVARGELDDEIPGLERGDEVGVMARALLVLRDTGREAIELRFDQLTGLPTRKLMLDRLRQAMAACSRTGAYGGLLLIDMDRFKAVNDTLGHDMGDTLLKQVADRLSSCVRAGDTVARLGGDEFVVVVVGAGQKEKEAATAVEAVGEKVLAQMGTPFSLGTVKHMTSASIGMTLFNGDGKGADDLLKQADLAMYKSKDTGRNACRFFDTYMEASVRARMGIERDLRQGMAEGQFELYFQPQIRQGGRLSGAEALIRWNHPQRGLVPPLDFIPQAEETGLIVPLGQWVLGAACRQLGAWANHPHTASLTLAVNVSARQFQRPDFVDHLIRLMAETGAPRGLLELELTESLLLDDVESAIEKMLKLRAVGLGLTLDDFGTGYSSLSYLKRLPLDRLKIDRSFVRDVLVNRNDAAIAKTVVALAEALALNVIAEGVETAGQRNFLAGLGCHAYQGMFFSMPLPLDQFEEFARRAAKLQGRTAFAVA